MGKWTKYKATLRSFTEEPTQQEKIDAEKERFAALDLGDIGEALKREKLSKGSLSEALKDLNIKIEALTQLLVERMESMSIEQIRLASGGLLTDTPALYPHIADKDAFYSWLSVTHPEMELMLPPSTFKALVSERLEQGESIPPGVEVFLKVGIYATGLINFDPSGAFPGSGEMGLTGIAMRGAGSGQD